jgi:hypothetical protein
MVLAGESGAGKSTLAAFAPVDEGFTRIVVDGENAMGYLIGDVEKEVFLPAKNLFQAKGTVRAADYEVLLKIAAFIEKNPGQTVVVDGLNTIQTDLLQQVTEMATTNSKGLAAILKQHGQSRYPTTLEKSFAQGVKPDGWPVIKWPLNRLVLAARKSNTLLVFTTHTGLVWEDDNGLKPRLNFERAKLWNDVLQQSDVVVEVTKDHKVTLPKDVVNIKSRIAGFQGSGASWDEIVAALLALGERRAKAIEEVKNE